MSTAETGTWEADPENPGGFVLSFGGEDGKLVTLRASDYLWSIKNVNGSAVALGAGEDVVSNKFSAELYFVSLAEMLTQPRDPQMTWTQTGTSLVVSEGQFFAEVAPNKVGNQYAWAVFSAAGPFVHASGGMINRPMAQVLAETILKEYVGYFRAR